MPGRVAGEASSACAAKTKSGAAVASATAAMRMRTVMTDLLRLVVATTATGPVQFPCGRMNLLYVSAAPRTRRVNSQITKDRHPIAATTEATGQAERPR